jgi:diguanylate cyclase (GGDEF)-like protein
MHSFWRSLLGRFRRVISHDNGLVPVGYTTALQRSTEPNEQVDAVEPRQISPSSSDHQLIQDRLFRLADVVPGALFILQRSPHGHFSMRWAADKLVEIAGCWPEDTHIDLSALTSSIHPEDAKGWHQAGLQSAQTLLPWHSEFRLVHPLRGQIWIEWRATPSREPNTHVVWHGFLHDISARKQHEQQLKFMANHDTLTGLPNRILLMDRMQQAIHRSQREASVLAVLFIDLDNFKPINDQYGHEAGDRTLIGIAKRMSGMLRSGDTVARIGGDEFVILLPGLGNTEECELLSQRLLEAITEPVGVEAHTETLSASIGIALYPSDAGSADSLLRCADEAMYTAKHNGRNQLVFFGNASRPNTTMDSNLVHDLRQALQQEQIEVFYQPIVCLVSGKVHKAEALVRWKHPERGFISPAEFIPIAEEAGLIHSVGKQVFQQATQTTIEWNRLCPGGPVRCISVNRSPREFQGRDGADHWVAHLQKTPAAFPGMLSLEITEGLLLNNRPKVLAQLEQLRSLGMQIALDDFGTGYSSLSYLKKFAIDYIKIDRSFVQDIVDDPADRAIVESIIAMAQRMGIKLIAEGVETQAQAALLAAAQCDYAQGFLYARPMPQSEFLAFAHASETTALPVPCLLRHDHQA